MSYLISIPIILILLILQTTLARQVTLLNGSVDLILIWLAGWGLFSKDNSIWFWAAFAGLVVAYVSALPWYVPMVAYFAVVIMARFVISKLWHAPLMSMFVITIFGSLILYMLSYLGLTINGYNFQFDGTLVKIIIPSVFLNLFVAIPIYAIVKDTAGWVFKLEVD